MVTAVDGDDYDKNCLSLEMEKKNRQLQLGEIWKIDMDIFRLLFEIKWSNQKYSLDELLSKIK